MTTIEALQNDPRALKHENTANNSSPSSEAEDLRRLIHGAGNTASITKSCVDCGTGFTVPAGTLFFNCHKRCTECAEINDVKLEADRIAEANRVALIERNEQWESVCPPLYRDFDPSLLPAKSRGMIERVVSWKKGPRGLLGIGASGAGKTRIFYQLVKRLMMEGSPVRVFDCVAFSHQCQSAFMNGHGEAWAMEIARAPVVFFDDLFKLAMTERVETELFGIIERRSSFMLPIIATLNSTGDMIEQRMSGDRGKPMVRRIREFNDVATFNL